MKLLTRSQLVNHRSHCLAILGNFGFDEDAEGVNVITHMELDLRIDISASDPYKIIGMVARIYHDRGIKANQTAVKNALGIT